MEKIAILDVGHGNSSVVFNKREALIVDAGTGNSLLLFLREQKITHVDKILISHADADHIGGLIGLISSNEITISEICLNSDAIKASKLWKSLVYELDKNARIGNFGFSVELTDLHRDKHSLSMLRVEILAPSAALAALSPGATDAKDRQITTNTISSVIKVSFLKGNVSVLLAADMDSTSLENILENGHDLSADVLIFPHHGGRAGGGKLDSFTEKLYTKVKAGFVIFSIGRGKHSTPNPDIVSTLRNINPDVRILCTQISKHCNISDRILNYSHLSKDFARGRDMMKSCAGTLTLINGDISRMVDTDKAHKEFVMRYIDSPLCIKE